MKIVIGGSYHKFLDDINKLHKKLEEKGHIIIAPLKDAKASKVNLEYDYILFQGEEKQDPVKVQQKFMDKINNADAFVVCNKNGYIGNTVAMELGWAYAGIKNDKIPLKQIYLTDHISLLDIAKRKGKITKQDIENDEQLKHYKENYNMNEEEIIDYCQFILTHIKYYESTHALTIGIDRLLEEKIVEEDEER